MRWLRKKDPEEKKAEITEKAQRMLGELQARIKQNLQAKEWGNVDRDMLKTMQLLRESSTIVSVSQSVLAELHGQWGLAMNGQRRHEEAYKHLAISEQLLNMDYESAVAHAEEEGIALEGEGDEIDLDLFYDVLSLLGESAVRQGEPRAHAILAQTVEVADLTNNEARRWEARHRLAIFASGASDWEELHDIALDMVHIARQAKNSHYLLEGMRFLNEAFVGLGMIDRAIGAQQLVVDTATILQDEALATEKEELEKLLANSSV